MWLQQRKLRLHPEAAADWPVLDFSQPPDSSGARLLVCRAERRQPGHLAARRLRQPALDGVAIPSADRRATLRCSRNLPPGTTHRTRASHVPTATSDDGAQGFLHAKLAGVRQLAHVITNQLSQANSRRVSQHGAWPVRKSVPTATGPQRDTARSHPRDSRVCRRRGNTETVDDPADAHGRTRHRVAALDPLARGSGRSHRIRRHRTGSGRRSLTSKSPTPRAR